MAATDDLERQLKLERDVGDVETWLNDMKRQLTMMMNNDYGSDEKSTARLIDAHNNLKTELQRYEAIVEELRKEYDALSWPMGVKFHTVHFNLQWILGEVRDLFVRLERKFLEFKNFNLFVQKTDSLRLWIRKQMFSGLQRESRLPLRVYLSELQRGIEARGQEVEEVDKLATQLIRSGHPQSAIVDKKRDDLRRALSIIARLKSQAKPTTGNELACFSQEVQDGLRLIEEIDADLPQWSVSSIADVQERFQKDLEFQVQNLSLKDHDNIDQRTASKQILATTPTTETDAILSGSSLEDCTVHRCTTQLQSPSSVSFPNSAVMSSTAVSSIGNSWFSSTIVIGDHSRAWQSTPLESSLNTISTASVPGFTSRFTSTLVIPRSVQSTPCVSPPTAVSLTDLAVCQLLTTDTDKQTNPPPISQETHLANAAPLTPNDSLTPGQAYWTKQSLHPVSTTSPATVHTETCHAIAHSNQMPVSQTNQQQVSQEKYPTNPLSLASSDSGQYLFTDGNAFPTQQSLPPVSTPSPASVLEHTKTCHSLETTINQLPVLPPPPSPPDTFSPVIPETHQYTPTVNVKPIDPLECYSGEIRLPAAEAGAHGFNKTMNNISIQKDDKKNALDKEVNLSQTSTPIPLVGTVEQLRHRRLNQNSDGALLSLLDFYKIRKIISKPSVSMNALNEFPKHVFSYVLQRVKFGGCNLLSANNILQLVDRRSGSRPTSVSNGTKTGFRQRGPQTVTTGTLIETKHPVSRLDCITYMLTNVDNIVAAELLRTMSQFPLALPLILKDFKTGSKPIFKLTSPLLSGVIIKWENRAGKVVEHCLFHNPFKMLLAVRLGDNSKGKSAILNQLLSNEFTFSTRIESTFGKPKSLDGSVEMIWLTQEICKPAFWNEVVRDQYHNKVNEILLLANLHGDGSDHLKHIRFLVKYFVCSVVVFVMPNCTEKMYEELKGSVGEGIHMTDIYVDDPNSADVDEPVYINMQDYTATATTQKIHNVIKTTFENSISVDTLDLKAIPEDSLFNIMHSVKDDRNVSMFMKLFSQNSCHEIRNTIVTYISPQSGVSVAEHHTDWKLLPQIVSVFISILCPMPADDVHEMMTYLEKYLARLSATDSRYARDKVAELKCRLNETSGNSSHGNIERDLKNAAAVAENSRLNVELFYRLVGRVYEALIGKNAVEKMVWKNSKDKISQMPSHVATQFIRGQPIELLDAESKEIPEVWLNAIHRQVCKLCPNLRVFVVSIIGLQSSGKSTLLNSLFACRFPVSVGSCSRGLLMRLLMLDEDLAKSDGYDAILLIDSEGLGSPEHVNERIAGKKDRLLATFAMGVSNLTLINTLGENTNELAGILQIALVAMTRLEEVGLSPDIFLVQHSVCERNSENLSAANTEFSVALQQAAALAENNVVAVGVRNNKCLDTLMNRLKSQGHIIAFRPYKNGATVHSPPSDFYHEDVVSLYTKILEFAKKATETQSTVFDDWYERVQHIWNSAKDENFAMRFRDVQQIHDFIRRGHEIAQVKRAIDDSFRYHMKGWRMIIERSQDCIEFPTMIDSEIDSIPDSCKQKSCEFCTKARELRQNLVDSVQDDIFKDETETTVKTHIKNARRYNAQTMRNMFSGSLMQRGHSEQINTLILEEIKLRVSPSKRFKEAEIRAIVDDIYEAVRKQVAADEIKDGDVRGRFRAQLKIDYYNTHGFVQQFDDVPENFEQIRRDAKSKQQTIVNNLVNHFILSSKPDVDGLIALRGKLEKMPSKIFSSRSAERYEDGMVADARSIIDDKMKTLCSAKQLLPQIQTRIHVWAQQLLCAHAEKIQDEWNKKNNVSWMLVDRKDFYKQAITDRISYGVGVRSEAKIIAMLLLNGIRDKAIGDQNNEIEKRIRSFYGISSTANIRLQYFIRIANEISKGSKSSALDYFGSPRRTIEKWFKDAIDNNVDYGDCYETSFQKQFKHIHGKLENSKTLEEFANVVTCVTRGYDFVLLPADVQCKDLKQAVLEEIAAQKTKMPTVNCTMFRKPSQNPDFVALLGCTEQCPLCGSLCLGFRDHANNADETRKHYTVHQPCGLDCRINGETDSLSPLQCHNFPDEQIFYIGSYALTGITWRDAKEKLYSDWKFERSDKCTLEELMRWFFQELHRDIASKNGVKPATPQDLHKSGCEGIKLHLLQPVLQGQIEPTSKVKRLCQIFENHA